MVARIELPDERLAVLVARYRSGVSVKRLAVEAGVDRNVVRRWLTEAGEDVRGRSAAMYVRMAQTSPDERIRLVAAANDAARGRSATVGERTQRAARVASRETWVGLGEDEVAEALGALGLAVERQVPVGPYNLDLAVGHVAIEVHRKTTYPLRFEWLAVRTRHLHEQGWAVVYLWCARGARVRGLGCVSPEAVSQVAALVSVPPGAFHVVRCTGEIATRSA